MNKPFERSAAEKAALSVEQTQAVCSSVRRKLLGGSNAVTEDDLHHCESRLATAKASLASLAGNFQLSDAPK